MINWTQGGTFPTGLMPGDQGYRAAWDGIQQSYHGVAMYPMFYVIGMLFAIGFCAWNFYRKQLSITDLAIGVIVIIPCSLFGGSFFGKLNAEGIGQNADGVGFWGLFAFWHAGMAIHGGVFTGVIVGCIMFGLIGHHTKTSLWTYMDAIIPNIFLGQAFGRWGNFFNHEVMGAPLADVTAGQSALGWLPHYIRVNTQVVYTGEPGAQTIINGMHMIPGHVYQMQPLFLYESIVFFIAWGLIEFVIPNIGKWIGPKPWKKHSDLYHLDWKQTFLNIFMFWKFPRNSIIETTTDDIYKSGQVPNDNDQEPWASSYFSIWKQSYEYDPDYNQREQYYQTLDRVQNSTKCLTKKRYEIGKALNKANNPDGYWTTRVGCQACAYFFVWNITRFACELQRPMDHLFIMYDKPLSLTIIMVSAFLGLFGMIATQTIAPMFFRQPGYLYEKPYFDAELIKKHWWTTSKKVNYQVLNGQPAPKTKFTIWLEKVWAPVGRGLDVVFGPSCRWIKKVTLTSTKWIGVHWESVKFFFGIRSNKRIAKGVANNEEVNDRPSSKKEAIDINVKEKNKQQKAEAKLHKLEAKDVEKSKPVKVNAKALAKQQKAEAKLAKMEEKSKVKK